MRSAVIFRFLTALIVLSEQPGGSAAAAQLKLIYDFSNRALGEGQNPVGNLVADKAGNLYGTAGQGGMGGTGAVFRLQPPSAGSTAWYPTIVYNFGINDDNGAFPDGLMMGTDGNLYGVSACGGLCVGNVYMLSPGANASRPWRQTILHRFVPSTVPLGKNGVELAVKAGLVRDAVGNLYGVAAGGASAGSGFVYKLAQSAAGHPNVYSVLYSFTGGKDGGTPVGGLSLVNGSLFGTATSGGGFGNGVVFQITPPAAGSSKWRESVLYSFPGGGRGAQPKGGLVSSRDNIFYGMTYAGGTYGQGVVFELVKPTGQTKWTELVLHSFAGGNDGKAPTGLALTIGPLGALFGVTSFGGQNSYGVAFKLTPPAAGEPIAPWSETILHAFGGAPKVNGIFSEDATEPFGTLLSYKNKLYGVSAIGGADLAGTVFSLTP